MRSFARAAVALFAFLIFTPFTAQASQPFTAQAFSAAQAAGKTVLIDVYASWCPVCRKQQPTIAALEKERPNLVVYKVDFDSQKDALRQFKVQRQSTLIMFKGKAEVGRLSYDSDPDNIRRLVAKGF